MGGNISDSVVDSSLEELSIQHHSVAASPQQAGQSTNESNNNHTQQEKKKTQNRVGQALSATKHSNGNKCLSCCMKSIFQ